MACFLLLTFIMHSKPAYHLDIVECTFFFKTVIPLYFSTKTILYLIDNFSLMMSKCANMSVLTDRVIYYHVNTFTPFLKIFTIWNCYINNRKKTLMQEKQKQKFLNWQENTLSNEQYQLVMRQCSPTQFSPKSVCEI